MSTQPTPKDSNMKMSEDISLRIPLWVFPYSLVPVGIATAIGITLVVVFGIQPDNIQPDIFQALLSTASILFGFTPAVIFYLLGLIENTKHDGLKMTQDFRNHLRIAQAHFIEQEKATQDGTLKEQLLKRIAKIDADEKVNAEVRRDIKQILNTAHKLTRDLGFDAIRMYALSIGICIFGLLMPSFGWQQYALISLFAAVGALFYGGVLSFETWRVTNYLLDRHSEIIDDQDERLFKTYTELNYLPSSYTKK